jgi:hypothetical protein
MGFDHEKFKNVADGVQSLVLAIGLIVGAVWTLYTFRHLASAQKASAELTEIERRQQPGFAIAIDTKCSTKRLDGAYELFISLELRNDGRQNIRLDLSEPSISLAKVRPENGGVAPVLEGNSWSLSPILIETEGLSRQTERYLRVGDSRHLAFVTLVPSAGTYLLQAQVPYRPVDFKDGEFLESKGPTIRAIEQQIASVPDVHAVNGGIGLAKKRRVVEVEQ